MGLDSVELVMAVEEDFGFDIPDEAAGTLVTVGLLRDYLATELRARGRPAESDEVLLRIKKVVSRQLSIDQALVVPEARFVEDMGVD